MKWTSTREHSTPYVDSARENGNPSTPREQPHQESLDSNSSITESATGAIEPTKASVINDHRYDNREHKWYCLECDTFCTSDNACDCCALDTWQWIWRQEEND